MVYFPASWGSCKHDCFGILAFPSSCCQVNPTPTLPEENPWNLPQMQIRMCINGFVWTRAYKTCSVQSNFIDTAPALVTIVSRPLRDLRIMAGRNLERDHPADGDLRIKEEVKSRHQRIGSGRNWNVTFTVHRRIPVFFMCDRSWKVLDYSLQR